MINLCIITANRAEYGILSELIKKLDKDKSFNLDLIVTGSHLNKKFGNTLSEINKDKIKISKIFKSFPKEDTKLEILKSITKSTKHYSNYFLKKKFDLLILFGDRYELIAPSLTAFFYNIPIAHINGGDVTQGSLDNNIRNFLSAISSLHFVTNKYSFKRVRDITGQKKNIYNVGSLSFSRIKKIKKYSKSTIKALLQIKFSEKNYLVTFHPITNEPKETLNQFNVLLNALMSIQNSTIIFTYPNNDYGSDKIIKLIENFIKIKDNTYLFKSLGFVNYINLCTHLDAVIGNSSSFILEIPFLKIPSIIVGNRQKGRIMHKTVIPVKTDKKSIIKALTNIKTNRNKNKNIYEKSDTIKNIIKYVKIFFSN